MVDESLERQVRETTARLQERDEAEAKRMEGEWRKAMERDTAGHVFGMFRLLQAQIASLQAQLDAANPLAAVMRTVADLNARLTAIETALAARGKGGAQE